LAAAWALGLSRPYDLVVFVMVAAGGEAMDAVRPGGRRAMTRLLELLWLAPVFVYYALVTGVHPSFSGWGSQAGDLSPPRLELIFALGPPAALVAAFHPRRAAWSNPVLRTFGLWCGVLVAVVALAWSLPMAKQFVVSLGTALLLWAACVAPVRYLLLAWLGSLPTSVLLFWLALHPPPSVFVADDYFAAAAALRSACVPGDLVIAPSEPSLLLAGTTPCHVALGHRLLTPRFAAEVAQGRRFYDEAASPAWRRAYLDDRGARFVLLPAGRGGWLRAAPAWERVLARPLLEVWARPRGL
jgi:hypothetical protein